jgi:serine O-acetyltransferase
MSSTDEQVFVEAPTSAAADAARSAAVDSIEIAPPATLSGIWPDLLAHAPPRCGGSWLVYVVQVFLTALLSSGFHMAVCYRIGALLHRFRLRPLCIIIEKFIYHWYHCIIPCSARIGPGVWIPHPLGIVLNGRARLGADVYLRQFTEIVHIWQDDVDVSGIVGDRVQLNSGAILLRGAVVGQDSIVAARAVVTKFVQPGHIAKGAPATASPMKPEQFRDRTPRWQ